MAREPNAAMHEEFKRWLVHRGINLNEVTNAFSIEHEMGLTLITFTMLVNDFPVREASINETDHMHIPKKGSDECSHLCRNWNR